MNIEVFVSFSRSFIPNRHFFIFRKIAANRGIKSPCTFHLGECEFDGHIKGCTIGPGLAA